MTRRDSSRADETASAPAAGKMTRRDSSRAAAETAFCGMAAALGTVLLMLSSLLSVLTYAAPLAASCLLLFTAGRYGRSRGWMTWAVTALLSLLLAAEKEAAFFYLFFGNWPLLKLKFDRIPGKALRAGAKLLWFAALTALMYFLLLRLLGLPELTAEFEGESRVLILLFFALLVLTLMLYDLALTRLERRKRSGGIRRTPGSPGTAAGKR